MIEWIKSWFKKEEPKPDIKCVGANVGHLLTGNRVLPYEGGSGGGVSWPDGGMLSVTWESGKPKTISFRCPTGEVQVLEVPQNAESMTVERFGGGGGGIAISGKTGGTVTARGGRGGSSGQPGEPGEFKTNMNAQQLYEFLQKNPPR